jgi:hypothetical protein
MIKAKCIYQNLTLVPNYSDDLKKYIDVVKPLDYDFGILLGAEYLIVGFSNKMNIPEVFLVPALATSDYEVDKLEIAPLVLFSIYMNEFPNNMVVQNSEIIPKTFAKIQNWFELYVDGQKEIVDIVEAEVLRLQNEARKYLIGKSDKH